MKLPHQDCINDCPLQEWYFYDDKGIKQWILACKDHTTEKIHPVPKCFEKYSKLINDLREKSISS